MVTGWRIVKAKYVASAFDGEGARAHGGRWNSPGVPMVYTSASISLAALEMLVHLGWPPSLGAYRVVSVEFAEDQVENLDRRRLPANWRVYPAPLELQRLGDEWARSRRSLSLAVPSAVIDLEVNYLLNPSHPEFAGVARGAPRRLLFDPRLQTTLRDPHRTAEP